MGTVVTKVEVEAGGYFTLSARASAARSGIKLLDVVWVVAKCLFPLTMKIRLLMRSTEDVPVFLSVANIKSLALILLFHSLTCRPISPHPLLLAACKSVGMSVELFSELSPRQNVTGKRRPPVKRLTASLDEAGMVLQGRCTTYLLPPNPCVLAQKRPLIAQLDTATEQQEKKAGRGLSDVVPQAPREGCRAVRCPAMCRCAFGQWPGLCGACPTHDAKNPCKVTRITHEHSKTTINSSALLSSWLVHR
eukprot:1157747-Pelagomonas_calceolata.AAC.2